MLILALAGCATRQPAPIEDRAVTTPSQRRSAAPVPVTPKPAPSAGAETESPPQAYTVKRGDTL
ncbi:MAG TPA: hypothetical protein VFC24_13645, partial [Casimicrobiaceae bacterium]|nr:hypothetical protein [Casimicrobiaceae bacterium]